MGKKVNKQARKRNPSTAVQIVSPALPAALRKHISLNIKTYNNSIKETPSAFQVLSRINTNYEIEKDTHDLSKLYIINTTSWQVPRILFIDIEEVAIRDEEQENQELKTVVIKEPAAALSELDKRETQCAGLVRSLLQDAVLEEGTVDSKSEKLIKVFYNLATVYTEKARVTANPEFYTDAAKFYQHVLIISKRELAKPSVVSDTTISKKYHDSIKKTYNQLGIIQKELVKVLGGNLDKLIDVIEEGESDKFYLSSLRSSTKHTLTQIDINAVKAVDSQRDVDPIYSDWREKDRKPEEDFIKSTRLLFEHITVQMKSFLATLTCESQAILGKPPCDYAVVGLGSMALQQITPYSDLEFIILTQDDNYKNNPDALVRDYFRNLAHLIHFRIINLGETSIPISKYNLDLSSLITIGVNFDLGGKTPLGRIDKDRPYELIQTVTNMLHYLENENDGSVHRDKTLPWILEATTHVYGTQSLTSEYQARVRNFLDSSNENGAKHYEARAFRRLAQESVEIDYLHVSKPGALHGSVDTYRPKLMGEGNEGKLFNAKHEIYRLIDRFLYDLAFYYGIKPESVWDAIEQLQLKQLIGSVDSSTAGPHHLLYAASFANILRLSTYDYYGYQKDEISVLSTKSFGLTQQEKYIFHLPQAELEESGALFKYYYATLPLHRQLEIFCRSKNLVGQDHFFREERFYDNSFGIRGQIYMRLLQHNKAIRSFKQALENHDKYSPESGVNFNKLGIAYEAIGEHEEAIKCYKHAIEIFKEVSDENHSDMVTSFINLGNACNYLSRYKEAINYCYQALSAQKTTHRNDLLNIATSIDNLGSSYGFLGEYRKAIKCHEQAIGMYSKIYGNEHPYIATSYDNLGNTYQYLSNYKIAIKYHKQALKIRARTYSIEHPSVAISLGNIGSDHCALGNHGIAIKYNKQALKIQKKIYETEHPDIAISFNNLGNVYTALGKYEEALEHHKQALKIQEKLYGEEHSNIADTFTGLGNAYELLGAYEEAIKSHNQALKIRKKLCGKTHPTVSNSLNKLAQVSHSFGKFENAKKYLEEALEINKKRQHKTHPNTAAQILYKDISHPETKFISYSQALFLANQAWTSSLSESSFQLSKVSQLQISYTNTRPTTRTSSLSPDYLGSGFTSLFKNWIYRSEISELKKILLKHDLDLNWQDALKGNGFKKVALKLHPDKPTGNTVNFQNFIRIKELLERRPSITLNEVLRGVQLFTNKAFLSLRTLDTSIATIKLYNEPTKYNLGEAGLSALHTFCSFKGFSKSSIMLSTASAFNAYQHEGSIGALENLLTSAAFIVAPYAITYIGIPFVGPAYTLGITLYTGYNLLSNTYALYKDLSSGDNTLKSLTAYRDLYLTLSQATEIKWFTEKAQEYTIQINRFNSKLEEESTLVQLEKKYGEVLGSKLFNYIYQPVIEEKHELAAQVELNNLSNQEANSILASRLVSVPDANYSICRLDESPYKLSYEIRPVYYCYSGTQQSLDALTFYNGDIEVIDHLYTY